MRSVPQLPRLHRLPLQHLAWSLVVLGLLIASAPLWLWAMHAPAPTPRPLRLQQQLELSSPPWQPPAPPTLPLQDALPQLWLRQGVIAAPEHYFAAMDTAEVPEALALKIPLILGSRLDFRRELQAGARFKVLYQEQGSHPAQLLAVEIDNQGSHFRAYANAQGQFYDGRGVALEQGFLRAPLEFGRVSAGFSAGRFHPILHRLRAHQGVDFAAPIGTPVYASADGEVSFRGTQGGYGLVVRLQHSQGIETVYGHLARFAPELHPGRTVHRGDTIAYVGHSGLATGPHLHYEFRRAGLALDPLQVALPMQARYEGDALSQHQNRIQAWQSALDAPIGLSARPAFD